MRWNLSRRTDPLQWVFSLVTYSRFRHEEIVIIRALLAGWCDANGCTYRRGDYKKNVFKALIIVQDARPVNAKDVNPLLVELDELEGK